MPLGSCACKMHGIKFNLMVSADCEPTSTSIDQRIGQNMKMHDQEKEPAVIPPIVTLIVAVVGTAGILLNDFGPGNASQGSSNAGMITAAAVSRVGAIEIPSEPPAGRS
jgi:hypothetical protein